MPKTYTETYLFRQYPKYEKQMFEFIMGCERIDTSSEAFGDILFDVKRRQVSSALYKVLLSKNVVLGIYGKTLPKAFKVFVAKDVREKGTNAKQKVFIDVSDCIALKNGRYVCNNIDWIISYLITAMNSYVYTLMETRITHNQSIIKDGGEAFAKMFAYIIDRIYKITTIHTLRKRVEYISAMYYQANILGKDYSDPKQLDTIKVVAMNIANIDKRDAQIVDIQLEENCFLNINTFIAALNKIFNFKDLSISLVTEKWMQAFGTGTIFAMEYYPAFAMTLTNAYVGGYIDQQLTIEKVTGQSMVKFTKSVLEIGAGVV